MWYRYELIRGTNVDRNFDINRATKDMRTEYSNRTRTLDEGRNQYGNRIYQYYEVGTFSMYFSGKVIRDSRKYMQI
jgi:hypothetical protein